MKLQEQAIYRFRLALAPRTADDLFGIAGGKLANHRLRDA